VLSFTLAFIISYFWHGFGITAGYHRLLAHRSFRCPKLVEYFFILAGYLAFEGSPIWWVAIHRAHHKNADTALDPHSPKEGAKWAYFGWMLKPDPVYLDPKSQCRDLYKDPLYVIMEKGNDPLMLCVNIAFRASLWLLFGWQAMLGNLLAAIVVLQLPLILNTVAHIPRYGYKTYDTADGSVNVPWLGYAIGGEGWHNNHHAFPGSARQGLKPNEFDLTWQLINLLHSVGLVSRVNLPSQNQIL